MCAFLMTVLAAALKMPGPPLPEITVRADVTRPLPMVELMAGLFSMMPPSVFPSARAPSLPTPIKAPKMKVRGAFEKTPQPDPAVMTVGLAAVLPSIRGLLAVSSNWIVLPVDLQHVIYLFI